ncbi:MULTISPECIES: nickel ABC transporter substrate-binding protein [unclassified Streptococcus]|uniref:nickel ABC transporter substrate-binding protein n=1 Tax=unclassified Streptococcus TaxID=2608887 RepID=UPI001072DDCD|nr:MULTISPECIES: nickel ABC transporter substrate-binding protein [unclassified Streptococcus]MBF0805557.1 nickel ABC transporter, nickel/metallophore periplasmic binding protein [Streptococcus sp. 19428wA2_WM07]TFU28925.1 nickel ABC transporter, nickel/metallophore periplasmic binding protein [Streptococcus sp. WM07]
MKKLLYLAMGFLLVLGLVGCQSQASKQKTSVSDSLTLAWGEDFGDINPHRYNPDQFVIQDMVYEGLVRYGQDGSIEPVLAEKWDISQDGKIYTFHLRDVQYSDGSPVTAENIRRNFDTIFSEENKSEHTWFALTDQIDSYQAIDSKTFQLTLKEAYSATLYDLAMIRPIRFLGDAGFPDGDNTRLDSIKEPIGTGPWVVADKKSNEYVRFKRNDSYWGPKPKLKEVTVRIIPDAQTRLLEFQAGEIDLLYGNGLIDLHSFKKFSQDSDYQTAVSSPMSSRLLLLNANGTIFADKKLRLAMQQLINKQEISESIFQLTEQEADSLFAKTTPHTDVELTPYSFAPDKAEKEMENQGWKLGEDGFRYKDGEKLVLRLPYIATKATDKDLAEYLQASLKQQGIDVQLQAMEEDAYWANAKTGNFDAMFTFSWGAPWDPHAWMTALTVDAAHGHPENIAIQKLPSKQTLDEVIKKTLIEPDNEKVTQGYHQALQILHDEAVYIPLTYQSVLSVYRKGELEGVTFAAEENAFSLSSIQKVRTK